MQARQNYLKASSRAKVNLVRSKCTDANGQDGTSIQCLGFMRGSCVDKGSHLGAIEPTNRC